MTEQADTSAVDYEFLCQTLSPNNTAWDCNHDRKRRAIGAHNESPLRDRKEYISQTDFGFFPWIVELNYYDSKNFKDKSAKPKESDKEKSKGTETHNNGSLLFQSLRIK